MYITASPQPPSNYKHNAKCIVAFFLVGAEITSANMAEAETAEDTRRQREDPPLMATVQCRVRTQN